MAPSSPMKHILALNSGSSSLKFGLYRDGPLGAEVILSGEAESIGERTGKFHVRDEHGSTLRTEAAFIPSQEDAALRVFNCLSAANMLPPVAIGHRIVHGGPQLRRHCLIDDRVLGQIEGAAAFAPLHTPPALSVMRFAKEYCPGVPQVACFDTSFHAAMPSIARTLPIARELRTEGIERYGFHGLSCESILHQIGDAPPDRLVIAHLGSGASVTAVRTGMSIDTSMGLTPTGGIIMGTRSGDLDPGVLVYLLRKKRLDADMLDELINRQSGLLGISGASSDMRELQSADPESDDRLAVQMFCRSVSKQIAGMAVALDGVGTIVFTGGIGENDAAVRAEICLGLSWMGVRLDEARNRSTTSPIHASKSCCPVLVLPSRENEQVARHTRSLLL
jgi:acetate kinase